jgi:hypothetical protein
MNEDILSEPIVESSLSTEPSQRETVLQPNETFSTKRIPLKKTIIIASLLLIVAMGSFALYKSKPNEDNFELWVKKEAAEKRKKSGNLVQKGVSIATQIQLLATYRYSDNLLFATVEAKANGEKLHFLGMANTWFLLP